jgi:molybdate/tungstate transport system substrate-binding protein
MFSHRRLPAALVAVALFVAACASATSTPATTDSGGTTAATGHGTADVAYAGSLVKLAETVLGPDFERATGNKFIGRGAGSTTLAEEILSKEISPGVFVSVGRKAIEKLETARARFAIQLATDPLVIAYNPHSKFAPQLDAISSGKGSISSLFSVLAQPGFRLGRTDPNADPQGAYFILMVELAQKLLSLPSTTTASILGVSASSPYGNPSQMFDETALVPTLQAGELDAVSAYDSQALQYHLRYISLPDTLSFVDPAFASTYGQVSLKLSDGSVFAGKPISLNETLVLPPATSAADATADAAFVAFLLSPTGRADLRAGGYTLQTPEFYGAPGATPSNSLPASVRSAFSAAGGKVASG